MKPAASAVKGTHPSRSLYPPPPPPPQRQQIQTLHVWSLTPKSIVLLLGSQATHASLKYHHCRSKDYRFIDLLCRNFAKFKVRILPWPLTYWHQNRGPIWAMINSCVKSLTKKNYTKIYVTYTWNILQIYVSYMYSLCRYMLAICICYIYLELGPTYMWHICKYMGSIWDW